MASAIAGPDPLLGTMAGSFRITQLLGRGGMGEVYLGEDIHIGSKVALKFIRSDLGASPELAHRLAAEARAANLAGHPGIVRILDHATLPGRGPYLVMEYVAGEPLSTHLARGVPPLGWPLQVLAQLCDAVAYAHRNGVVHRDLKPDNVMIAAGAKSPVVKVMDFGIAKLQCKAGQSTLQGALVGTPEYMAPEQCDGRAVDARTDVYALGVMAYALCTGRTPFVGTSIGQLLVAHLTATPPPPQSLRPDLPRAWQAAILRALAKRPEDRFQTPLAFLRGLYGSGDDSPQPAASAPERRRVRLGLDVALDGKRFVRVEVLDLSRGGALIALEGPPPPLFSRVYVRVPCPNGSVAAAAEVVRHVGAQEAAAWGVEPGFAVQFVAPGPALAQAIATLIRCAPSVAPPEPRPGGALSTEGRTLLTQFAARLAGSHYEVLAVGPGSTRAEIVAAGQRAVVALGVLEQASLDGGHLAQVRACLQRVAAAIATLGSPRERMRYDARRGNHAGVAQAIASKLWLRIVEEEHQLFLRERPDVPARVEQHLARARLASRRDNLPAALREIDTALQLSPLDLRLHERYAELRQAIAG